MKLQILMSSYNGEKYIGEQLDSLISQSLCSAEDWNVEILVRDDGSTDATCNILHNYQEKYDFIRYVKEKNVGVISSFFELIKMSDADADYLALSDQDDVWQADKMQTAVDALNQKDAQIPLLYCGRVQPTDEALNPIDTIFFTNEVQPAFGNAMVENICTGCTAVFNQKLAKYIRQGVPEYTAMHDWWLYILATTFGEVVYDINPHMLYRQHSLNTVGVRRNYWSEFVARTKRFKANRYQIRKQVSSLAQLSQEHGWNMTADKENIVHTILDLHKHMGARWRLMRSKDVYRQRKGDNLIFKLIILTGTL